MSEAQPGAADTPLAGRGVLITRPRARAATLASLVQAAGGRALVIPALEILEPSDPAALHAAVAGLPHCALAIFVSPTAAERGLQAIGGAHALPPGLLVAAIGAGTARELERLGVAEVIYPSQAADSESLLALPQLERVQGQDVAVFRGEGGRELLAETLARRGARVTYIECYRRGLPQTGASALRAAVAGGEVDATVATSGEVLENLDAMLDATARAQLRTLPVFVPHERVRTLARARGYACVIATPAGDAALVAAMVRSFAQGLE